MSKLFTAVILITSISSAYANDVILENLLNAKKRVRLELWYNGISEKEKEADKAIPVEIEKALKDFVL